MSLPQSEVEHDQLGSRRSTRNTNSVSSSFNYSQDVIEGQGEIEDNIKESKAPSSESDEDFVVERGEKRKKRSGLKQNKKPMGKKAKVVLKNINFPNHSLPPTKESTVNKSPPPSAPEVDDSPSMVNSTKNIETPKKGQVLITRKGGQVTITEHLETPQSSAFTNISGPQSVKRSISCDAQLMDLEQGIERSQQDDIEAETSIKEISSKSKNTNAYDESYSELKQSKHSVIEPSNNNIKFKLAFEDHGVDQIEDAAGMGSITIATPDRINMRGDINEVGLPAPSTLYAAEEFKEIPNIVKHMKEQSAVTEILPCPPVDMTTMIHPPRSTVCSQDTVTTAPSHSSQSGSCLTPSQMRALANKSTGRGRGTIGRVWQVERGRGRFRAPGVHHTPHARQPNLMLRQFRPIRPRPSQGQLRMNSHPQYRPSASVLEHGPGPFVGKPRPPKQYSLSAPNSNNFEPQVIQLDSPDREGAVVRTPSSRGSLEGAVLSSIPSAMPDLILPPGISITRTPRSSVNLTADHVSAAALTSLARALACLGETQGGKRHVTLELTESQVEGLRTLGLYET